ncbi:hypothetical protein [Streptomyces sp. NRRL S-646]|uniref:hypothetical protein n=1 Tax=Streptomyces sp. NRRL S-646 TaxID=1463917 RepID=UPI001331BD8D|nr:hypothetical protein [Streptomyces sp. NRRL S-646]
MDPADRTVVHTFTGDEGEDHDVALTALEGVHDADAHALPTVLPQFRAEFVGLEREGGDSAAGRRRGGSRGTEAATRIGMALNSSPRY